MVCGSFPPLRCGVGEYAYHLAQALLRAGIEELEVLTSSVPGDASTDEGNIQVHRVIPNWSSWQLLSTLRFIVGRRPDVVHIQYPSSKYNGPLASLLPFFLRLRGIRVVQTWHEHFNECRSVAWPNLLGCDALIHVRPDLPDKLPNWVKRGLTAKPVVFIRNASTIPVNALDVSESQMLRQQISEQAPIVAFFGFANINKGVDRLFQIADPERHHLLLICDLDPADSYQKGLLDQIAQPPWKGKVTVTGFQSAEAVAGFLAVSDAVLFPFPGGAGEWNTSLQAAEAAGAFSLATTQDRRLCGFDATRNLYLADCDDLEGMRNALATHLGRRIDPDRSDVWRSIAQSHIQVYQSVVRAAGS